jgi:hypothetical protein
MPIIKPAAMGFAALVLGACTPPWPEADHFTKGRAFQAAETNCYVSLADRECYREPIPGQRYRRAGLRVTEPR